MLPERGRLSDADFILLAGSIQSRRRQHYFLLTAWVLLPDHWHAIFMSPYPSTMSHPTDSSWVATVHFFLIFDLTRLEISARLEAYTAGVGAFVSLLSTVDSGWEDILQRPKLGTKPSSS